MVLPALAMLVRTGPVLANPGTPDPTFGSLNGTNRAPSEAHGVVVQLDGRDCRGGLRRPEQRLLSLTRHHPNGTVDTSFFGGTGTVLTDFGASDTAWAPIPAARPEARRRRAWTGRTAGLRAGDRYNPDGSLDSSFGAGGKVTTDFNSDDVANAVALQPDGQDRRGGFHGPLLRHQPFQLSLPWRATTPTARSTRPLAARARSSPTSIPGGTTSRPPWRSSLMERSLRPAGAART